MENFKKIISIILMMTLGGSCIDSINTFAADYNFDDTKTFNRENLDAISFVECYLAYNIFELLLINENKMEILNAFNALVKKNQPYIEGITFELWGKFIAFLSMILEEANIPIDEINIDDFMFIKDDKALNFTFIFIINSYIKYIEDNNLTSRIDITEAKKLLKELKEANDYFATHKN